MSTDTYTLNYLISTPDGINFNIAFEQTIVTTVSYGEDRSVNGTTTVVDAVNWTNSIPADAYSFIGHWPGDSIIIQACSDYKMVSDTTGLSGSFVLDTRNPYTYCFLTGTQIATPSGERAVE